MGGGKDLDQAFRWLCTRSGGGDFLILRATGTDAYNPYIQGLCKVNSVATLIIGDRAAASDPFVEQTIGQAEAIFIAGGDQANYIRYWRGTPVQAALNDAVRRGVPIGGTSAGLAVQGEFIYSAENDPPDGPDLTSKAALANPFQPQVVIVHSFIENPLLKSTITDSHFVSRDRMGRLLAFLARIDESNPATDIRGIGIDERTAVLLAPDGRAQVVGASAAYFLRPSRKPAVIQRGVPLSFSGISVEKVTVGGEFDLKHWTGNAVKYTLSVDAGVLHSTQSGGAIY